MKDIEWLETGVKAGTAHSVDTDEVCLYSAER